MANKEYLTKEEMVEIGELFSNVYSFTKSNMLVEDSINEVNKFVADLIVSYRPYMIGTEAGVVQLVDRIFRNENLRDFIFGLEFNFFARLGNDEHMLNGLNNTIINSLVYYENNNSVIPKQIMDRLPTKDKLMSLFENNRWAIIVVMLIIFVKVEKHHGSDKS